MANTQQRVTNITANATPTPAFNVSEYRTLTVDVSGTFVATLQVQTSINGTTWRNVTGSTSILNLATGAYLASGNITAAGMYAVDVSSLQYVRLITTSFTSGTVVIETTTVTTGNLNPAANAITISGGAANPSTGTTGFQKLEDTASASGDAGAFVLGVRIPAVPTSATSAAGDYGGFAIDNENKLLTIPFAPSEYRWKTNPITLTTTTSTALKTAGGAGIFNHLTDIDIANTSATAVRVDLLDATTVIRSFYVKAGDHLSRSFTHPIATVANSSFNVQLSAAVTDVRVSANGYISV